MRSHFGAPMANNPKWVKGVLRLSVVLYVVIWISFSLFMIRQTSNNMALLEKHLSPLAGIRPFESDWCAIIASDDFLSKPEADRIVIAERFFEARLEGLTSALYIDAKKFKRWFAKTPTLSFQEAPIKYSATVDGREVAYRDIPLHGMPDVQLSKIFFDPKVLGISFLGLLAVMIPGIVIFLSVRWVLRGFKSQSKIADP